MRKIISTPYNIGKLTIKNRIVMEAMGNGISELNGDTSAADIAFYNERAKGGVGLIMSEAVSVDSETGRANPRNMCIDRDSHIEPLMKLTDELHKYDCKFFVELYHPGRQGIGQINKGDGMLAPSDVECKLTHQKIKVMNKEDIAHEIEMFVNGAVRAKAGGADGVLIHAAHGYLINEFLSPYTNKRDDEYGGTKENRARFATDIIREIKNACGKDYPVGIRFTACEYLDYNGQDENEGITLELSKAYVKMFEAAGADLIDVSSGIYETMNTAWEPVGFEQGWKTNLAHDIKKITKLPVICTSVIRDPEYAEQLLQDGVCDFVGSARTHLADPEWASKAISCGGGDIRKCISCLNCMKTLMTGSVKCAVNAQACNELDRCSIRRDGADRKVVVIGGGPAGMEAARVLALRNFSVTLFEKNKYLGGTFYLASLPPHKAKMDSFNKYLEGQLENLGVEVILDRSPRAEEIRTMNPYAVFVACGTEPIRPKSIPGIDGKNVKTVTEVLRAEVPPEGKNLLVIGGGMSGLECAEYLDSYKNKVDVYEMTEEFAPGEHFQNIVDIMHRLGNVGLHSRHRLIEVRDGECEFENMENCKTERIKCDGVVLAMGMKGIDESKYEGLPKMQVIGSNKKFGSVAIAVEDAYLAAYNLD